MGNFLMLLVLIVLASEVAACAMPEGHYGNIFRHSGRDHDRSR